MNIGLVKEIKNHEYRVALTPGCVSEYISSGHRVLVEKNAGVDSGYEDLEYMDAGAEIIIDSKDVWAKSDMIIKVKEPIRAEYKYLRKGLLLYTYLHLAANRPLTNALIKSQTTSIAYETITDKSGGLPCLTPMSEIAGRMSAFEGAKYLEKTYGGRGILLSGVPGVARGNITVIGGGNVGINACKIAVGLGASVAVLDTNIKRLAYFDDIFGSKIQTLYSSPTNIKECLRFSDIVIGAVLIPGTKAPKLIQRDDLPLLKKGSVLVDVAVDQGGCFETTVATTHQKPTFVVDDIVHYCVANMPGAVPRSATLALTNTTLGIGIEVANKGFEQAVHDNPNLRAGVNTFKGIITYNGVADAFGMESQDIQSLI
jgi:alanine dehydrogenase